MQDTHVNRRLREVAAIPVDKRAMKLWRPVASIDTRLTRQSDRVGETARCLVCDWHEDFDPWSNPKAPGPSGTKATGPTVT